MKTVEEIIKGVEVIITAVVEVVIITTITEVVEEVTRDAETTMMMRRKTNNTELDQEELEVVTLEQEVPEARVEEDIHLETRSIKMTTNQEKRRKKPQSRRVSKRIKAEDPRSNFMKY